VSLSNENDRTRWGLFSRQAGRHRHRPTVLSFYVRGAEIKRESTFRADKGNDWRQSGPVS
jgi:hypothetical protein